jgi:hypothetical protein
VARQLVLLFFLKLASACGLPGQSTGLGRVDFPTSGAPEAQKHFLRGLLFLHSFEYEDAREEFQSAQKMAPSFAMAYWGEAMTFNGPIMFFQDRDSARAALNRLAPTVQQRQAKAPTARENATCRRWKFCSGRARKTRDLAFADEMSSSLRAIGRSRCSVVPTPWPCWALATGAGIFAFT